MRLSRMRDRASRARSSRRSSMRNPYGSRGGYVVSDRRKMRDYGHSRMGENIYDAEYGRMGSDRNYRGAEYEASRSMDKRYGQPSRDYMGYGYHYEPYMTDYYGYDYGDDEFLSDEELMDWSRELLRDVEEKDKPIMTREHITQKAKEMGIQFKDYTEDELVVATLMVYTDYKKTLGTGNVDLYIRLGRDWLEDEDSELKGGEKLAAYYDEVICAD